MADISDVEQAIVNLVAGALYPNGTSQPSAVSADCRIYRGWPVKDGLQADMRAGTVNINVWAGHGKNTTRFPAIDRPLSIPAPTLSAAASGNTVTLSGAVGANQNVAVIVNGIGYVYAVQANDTLSTVAAALAALIGAGASSSGPTLTVVNAHSLVARVGVVASTAREVARFRRSFQINIWAPNPSARDAVGKAIKPVLADLRRMALPDGTTAQVTLDDDFSQPDDGLQKEQVYRVTYLVSVEYGLTVSGAAATVVVDHLVIESADSQAVIATIDT